MTYSRPLRVITPDNAGDVIPGIPDGNIAIPQEINGWSRATPADLDHQRVIVYIITRQRLSARLSQTGRSTDNSNEILIAQSAGSRPGRILVEEGVSLWFNGSGSNNGGNFLSYCIR